LFSGEETKRVCLLTGAAGTFGHAFCRLHANRYAIAAIYHRIVPALASQETTFFDPFDPAAPVADNDNQVFGIQADLATQDGCEWAVQAALDRFGSIDLVVHAAARSVWGNVLESDDLLSGAEAQFSINVLAPLRLSALVARRDWAHHDAAENSAANRNIVGLSSTAGVRLYEQRGQSVYGASKAALNHLLCHLADEFTGIGVRVNVIAPDSFPEPVPLADVVDAVTDLDRSGVTGKVLLLDAGGRRWLTMPRQSAGDATPPGGRLDAVLSGRR
jgi:NAD(P)-dependent dehydrogenase (short-subunit alcohol dehydrogenase family)